MRSFIAQNCRHHSRSKSKGLRKKSRERPRPNIRAPRPTRCDGPALDENIRRQAAFVDEIAQFSEREGASGPLRIVERVRPDRVDVAKVALNRIVEKNRTTAARLEH